MYYTLQKANNKDVDQAGMCLCCSHKTKTAMA